MSALLAYRDDGPVASALARLPAGPAGLLAGIAAVAPLGAALAVERSAGPWTGVGLAWCILVLGVGGRERRARLAWLDPVIVRTAEYGLIISLVALDEPGAIPAAYAVIFAAAMHQYEIVYRLRHLGAAPPPWVGRLAGGWELRMALVYLLARSDTLGPGLYAYAAAAGLLFVVEASLVWTRVGETG